jgi:hypothetical protein
MAGNPMHGAAAGRVGGDFLKPQTTAQVLRCFDLGGYAASVVEGQLRIRGPQPLAGPLPASIKANRERIIDFLVGCCGGVWPAAEGSEFVRLKREASAKMVPEVSDKQKTFQVTLRRAARLRRAGKSDRPDVLPTASSETAKLVRGA